ncbi:MAG: hypothetical protein VW257_08855, partial [Quisquiliibacterium sp.]
MKPSSLPSPQRVRWAMLVGALLAWELVPRAGWLPELFLPSLSKTLSVLSSDWKIYGSALLITLGEVLVSMLIACGGGIGLGAIVGGLVRLRVLLMPIFSSLYAVPIVILYPVFT